MSGRSRRALLQRAGVAVAAGAVGTAAYGQLVRGGADGAERPSALVAGSLLQFAESVPGATVEAHGSAAVRQLVLNGLRDPDAVALADPRLFAGVSERATLFATNALVLAYDPDGALGAADGDWRAALEEGVRLGRTDPDADPLGYRTVLALRLAEREFGVDAARVLDAARVFPETELLNVVRGGKVDAAFAYRNMAVQQGLPHLELPDGIDFSSPTHANDYRTVSYDLDGETLRGAPIRYAATALTAAGDPWVGALTAAGDRLRAAGFSVPDRYPTKTRV